MIELLEQADRLYRGLQCCHLDRPDGTDCRCSDCLHTRYYGGTDYYTCLKCLSYYTMNYGPAYVSEVYHYLSASHILENFQGTDLNVLSLGCGFGPDLIALRKYIADFNLPLALHYRGVDLERNWENLRHPDDAPLFVTGDVVVPFQLDGYDLVIISKLFSTLLANGLSGSFLDHLSAAIQTLREGSILLFVDINLQNKGRDAFDYRVRTLFRNTHRYFYPIENAYTGNYTAINNTHNVCEVPPGLSATPKPDVNKTVVFQYIK